MALSFIGNYYDLTEFLYRLRNGVTVRDGVLNANGRLFTVDSVNWHASDEEDEKFPLVQADLIVSAYVYGSDVDLIAAQVAADAANAQPPTTTGTEPGSTGPQPSTTPTDLIDGPHGLRAGRSRSDTLMAHPTAAERAAAKSQQRAAKQKKILLVLVPVLIALVAWQGPKLMKQLKGDETAAPAAAETATSESALPAPAPAAAGELTDPTAMVPGDVPLVNPNDPEAVAAATRSLPNSEQLPVAAKSADRLQPLRGQRSVRPARRGGRRSVEHGCPGRDDPAAELGNRHDAAPDDHAAAVDVHADLGHDVDQPAGRDPPVGATFPTTPAFKIVAIHSDSVEIGIADGSFSGGQPTITVKKGEEVTLVSQPDGARFTLKVVEIN